MAKQYHKNSIDLTEKAALRESEPIYVKPGSRIRNLIRAALYWKELHWMDGFLIFPTWLKKTQSSNYLKMFESVVAKVTEELDELGVHGVKLKRRKNTGLWRLEFPHKNRPTFSIDKTIELLEQSRKSFSEGNCSSWDLMIEACKDYVNPRNIWQTLIYANELPKKELMQKPEFYNIKILLEEHRKTLVKAITIVSRKASSGIQGLSFQNSSEALARWIVEIVNVNNVLDLFSGIIIPEPEQKNLEIVSLVGLLNNLKESTGEDAGNVSVEVKEAMDQEASALLEKLCKHPIVQDAWGYTLSFLESLSHKVELDEQCLENAMCNYILGMQGTIRPHSFNVGQFYKDIRIFAENCNTQKHVLNDICNSPDLPSEEKEKAISALLEEIVQEEELTDVVEEIANILKRPVQQTSQETAQQQAPPSSIQPEETLKLQKKVIEVDKKNKDQNLFRFEYCWPTFVGRDKEMQRLYKFVNYENGNLLWWTITGKGGTGKSRLALKLCRELEKQDWYAGFLTNTNGPDVWRKWTPQKPTLIVVDYTHEKAKELGEHIGNKYEESKQWKHPVRILFLERNKESKVLTDFCYPNSEVIKNNIRYREDSDSLELKGLGSKFIDSIIAGVFDRYPNKNPSTDEIRMIKSFLKGKGHENRPLYAMFIADAYARGEDVRGWNTDKLHESVLEHNRNIWKRAGVDENNDLDKKHVNLLTLATLTNGVNIEDSEYAECFKLTIDGMDVADLLPAKHKFSDSKYRILCDNELGEELSPMAPDILGEYFVLRRCKGDTAEACEMELLMKLAWQYKPWGVIDFISRVAMDFPADEKLDKIVEFAKTDEKHHFERYVLLFNLVCRYGEARIFDKAVKYYEQLEDIWNSHQKNKGILLVLPDTMAHLAFYYGEAREFDKAVKYYERVEDLWNSGYQKDKYISRSLAKAAYSLTYCYYEVGEFNKAVKYYERAENLWNSGYQKDKFISRSLANMAFILICHHRKAGRVDKAVKYCECLERLWNSGHQKDKFISRRLTEVFLKLTHYYAKAGKFDKAVKYYRCVEDLWNSGYQKDKFISRSLANMALSLTSCYSEAREFGKAVKYYERAENLWNSGYQKDKDISRSLANAAVLCLLIFDEKGETNISKQYEKKFMELYNRFPGDKDMESLYRIFQ